MVVALLALFVALGGSAAALSGSNTVQSDDLGPGAQVKAPDVAANAVNGGDVVNNSLTGADVKESSLGQVPSALLGGFGRSTGGQTCNPENPPGDFFPCAVVTRNVSQPSRFLLIGQARAIREGNATSGTGDCRLGTTGGPIVDSQTFVSVEGSAPNEVLTIAGVTGRFPAGQPSFGIDCRETTGGIQFADAGITAVAISPG
jgi:hypothetical protein